MNAISLHECRHTFASLMIAAGVNAKALQTFMGHASITVTLDLYGHLMPGAEAEAASLLNAYLGRFEGVRGEIVGKSSADLTPNDRFPAVLGAEADSDSTGREPVDFQ